VTTWFEMDSTLCRDGRVRLIVDGELDIATVPRLRELLCRLAAEHADVVLDLTGVTFLDSTTVRLLWSLGDRHPGAKLVIAPPVGRARELLEMTGVLPRPALPV
jgi:anti-anti-sigma factor